MRPKSRHSSLPGFTLTELLVVIVIIVTLVALSMVGIRRMRDMADKATAIRNLSQLQLANAGYATENGGRYVPKQVNGPNGERLRWWFQVPEFLHHLRGEYEFKGDHISETVPLNLLDPKVVRNRGSFHKSMAASFGINETGIPSSGTTPNARHSHSMASVHRPEQSMSFSTATDLGVRYPARLSWFSKSPDNRENKTSDGGLAYRHGDKIIVVYFDGHVGELSKADIQEIDRNRGGVRSAFWRPIP